MPAVALTDLVGPPCLVSLPQEVGKRIGIFEGRDSYSAIFRVSHESGDPRSFRKASGAAWWGTGDQHRAARNRAEYVFRKRQPITRDGKAVEAIASGGSLR